jgi:adenine-specific DNA-methyltransferase
MPPTHGPPVVFSPGFWFGAADVSSTAVGNFHAPISLSSRTDRPWVDFAGSLGNGQPEQIKAFRDTWELGIHSYLTYLRDRLTAARDLLAESGSVFVQIGDENVHLIRNLLDEVFGTNNFLSQISFSKSAGGLQSAERVGAVLDFIVWYAKDAKKVKYRAIYEAKTDAIVAGYTKLEMKDGTRRTMTKDERTGKNVLNGRPYMTVLMTKPGPGAKFDVVYNGRTYDSGNRWWGTTPEGLKKCGLFVD